MEIWKKTQHNIIDGLYIFLNICTSAIKKYETLRLVHQWCKKKQYIGRLYQR